jgi:hypothetical protein
MLGTTSMSMGTIMQITQIIGTIIEAAARSAD